ncbi:MAG TPA: serine/threonine-protein kinase [Pirellulales bacterium]|jgi:serine/threonine-protein kinase|nr:serine/threonine-protein kinase [Pirellulales bacterium]
MKPSASAAKPADSDSAGGNDSASGNAVDPAAEAAQQDERLCELLDRYVGALQAGDDALRETLAREHPQIARLAGCLHALDSLARPPGEAASATVAAGDPTPTISSQFGKYELLAEIGRGGMGVVYKAGQTDLGRSVALKMILASRLASPGDVRRFQREARAAGSLRHPHIVGIHEVGECHGQHYFTMDFIAGEDLARRLARGPIDAETAARLLLPVARAVDYLHTAGMLHRDLKPSNILIDERQQPFVTDFGLAKFFQSEDERTETGMILGTPSYMSPEQAAGRGTEIGPRSDVYSLGAILYEMLTRRPPFTAADPFSIRLQVLEQEPPAPSALDPRVPRELERICLGCLEKNPADRYPSAAALAADLDRFLRGEPVEIPSATPRQKLLRWCRRQPALVSHLAGLALVMLIVQVKYMISGSDWAFHERVMGVMGLWGAAAIAFQWLLNQPAHAAAARYGWAVADVILLTTLLAMADEPLGPLVISYPLVLVAAGLWFSVRLVAVTTLAELASYAGLLILRPEGFGPMHYRLIFGVSLAVIGWIVAYQVHRLRTLSRYFERERPE